MSDISNILRNIFKGTPPRQEQEEVARGVSAFLKDPILRVLLLEADAGIGKTSGVAVPVALHTNGRRMLYVTNTKKNRRQVLDEIQDLKTKGRVSHLRPIEISSRYDYVDLYLFGDWLAKNQAAFTAPLEDVEQALETRYPGGDVVHQDSIRQDILPVADFNDESTIPWLNFAASRGISVYPKEQVEDSNVEIITQAMLVYNRLYEKRIKKGLYSVVIIDEMDQLISVCDSVSNVKTDLNGIISDLKYFGQKDLQKLCEQARRAMNGVFNKHGDTLVFASDEGFNEKTRKKIETALRQASDLWETREDSMDQTDPRLNMLISKFISLASWLAYSPERQSNFYAQAQQFITRQGSDIILSVESNYPATRLVWLWRLWDERQKLSEGARATKVIAMSACMGIPGRSNNFLARYSLLSKHMAIGRDIEQAGRMKFLHVPSKYIVTGKNILGHGTSQFFFPKPEFPKDSMFDNDGVVTGTYINEVIRAIEKCRLEFPDERIVVLAPAFRDLEIIGAHSDFGLPNGNFVQERGGDFNELVKEYLQHQGPSILYTVRWEGLDLPGMVENLVITRLPFSPPSTGAQKANMDDYVDVRVARKCDEYLNNKQFMVRRSNQGLGRGIRRPDDLCRYWLIDPRMPKPVGGGRGDKSYSVIYPERFRKTKYHQDLFNLRFRKLHVPQKRRKFGGSIVEY